MRKFMWLVLLLLQGCSFSTTTTRTTTVDFLIPLAYHKAPPNWTPPSKYAQCKPLDEVILEDGTPDGLPTVRVQCPKDGPMIWFHRDTKKIVQIRRWDNE